MMTAAGRALEDLVFPPTFFHNIIDTRVENLVRISLHELVIKTRVAARANSHLSLPSLHATRIGTASYALRHLSPQSLNHPSFLNNLKHQVSCFLAYPAPYSRIMILPGSPQFSFSPSGIHPFRLIPPLRRFHGFSIFDFPPLFLLPCCFFL